MASDPCPPWTRWEIIAAWFWTIVTIYTAWHGVAGWWGMFVVFWSWAGGMSLGMTIQSRCHEGERSS